LIGQTLSHFRITAKLGQGGMGVVYRADDTKLGREVAIKVLPEEFTQHEERLGRFKREAKVLAALNHPHIAAIYEVGEVMLEASSSGSPTSPNTVHFIAMELAEGETLADLIGRGPVPLPRALTIAAQIARALEAAHDKDIIHRDLKPSNIKISSDGTVKVLDFGLAKAGVSSAEDPDFTHSPTLTAPMAVLGTASYMSPEQARGQGADQRSDIWGLGCVLYEMLLGQRLFRRDTVTETIAAILERDPDWSALPADTPPLVFTLLKRCLEKDPHQRLHHAADVRIALEEATRAPRAGEGGTSSGQSKAGKALWFLVGAAAAAAIAVGAWMATRPGPSPSPTARFELQPPAGIRLDIMGSDDRLAISPDGTQVAFRGQLEDGSAPPQIFLRSTSELTSRALPGTENASSPFFSPDGRWLGFWVDRTLKKIPLAGGEPIRICETPAIRGAAWGQDGTIVLGSLDAGLRTVSSEGGTPEPLTTLDSENGERDHRWPQFLPGDEDVLYNTRSVEDEEVYRIAVTSLGSGDQRILKTGGTKPLYVSSGHLLYSLQGTVYAIGFDPVTFEVRGSPRPVLQDVQFASGSGNSHLALSEQGALVWVPGAWRPLETELIAISPDGKVETLVGEGRSYESPQLSPNGLHLAVTIMSGVGEADIWIYEIDRELWRRLTSNGGYDPLWSPDGRSIVFSSNRNGPFQLFMMPADGSSEEEAITETTQWEFPGSFSPDGRLLLFQRLVTASQWDLFSMDLEGDRIPRVVLGSSAMEINPTLSPDGRWLAYSSDQAGRSEIYVQPFLEAGPRVQVSTHGGIDPVWSPDGTELLYIEVPNLFSAGRRLLATPITTRPDLAAGRPRLFAEVDFDIVTQQAWHAYSFLPDNRGVVMVRPIAGTNENSRLVYAPTFADELSQPN
jgi:Tol biopolymer transport system component